MRLPFFPEPEAPYHRAVARERTWENRWPKTAIVARALACWAVTVLPVLFAIEAWIRFGSVAGLSAAGATTFGWLVGAAHRARHAQRGTRPLSLVA